MAAGALALGAALTFAGSALAYSPERDDGDGPAAAPRQWVPIAGPAEPPGPPAGSTLPDGYDISYPQCSGSLPPHPSFAVVGVNGGKVFSVNPCLADELAWGGGAGAQLYANTGNPGPGLSRFWPFGQTSPRFCDETNPDTADCAYDFGWNAAKVSFVAAQSAYAALDLVATPAATQWWLDVETSNSWRTGAARALNVAALQGEVDAFHDLGVTRLGIYSSRRQWNRITAGSTAFAAYPSWLAGGVTLKGAQRLCAQAGFTGGASVMAQYFFDGFDADLAC